jgi:DNA-binding NtrC family response regulator
VISANGHGAVEAVAKPFDVDYMLDVIGRLLA